MSGQIGPGSESYVATAGRGTTYVEIEIDFIHKVVQLVTDLVLPKRPQFQAGA